VAAQGYHRRVGLRIRTKDKRKANCTGTIKVEGGRKRGSPEVRGGRHEGRVAIIKDNIQRPTASKTD